MPVTRSQQPPVIAIHGKDFEPADGSFERVRKGDREAYFRQLAKYAYDQKLRELNKAIAPDGSKLLRRQKPRRDHATGPVLSPHWSESRFQTALRWAQRNGREAVLYWVKPWSRIVGYWSLGVRGIVRDVVGLTDQSIARIKSQIAQWWSARVAKGRMGEAAFIYASPPLAVGGKISGSTFAGSLPQRPALFASPAPVPIRPAIVPPPELLPNLPAYTIVQKLNPIYEAAGVRQTTLEAIQRTVRLLGRTQAKEPLIETAKRFGIKRPIETKKEAVRLIGLTLTERWRSARPGPPLRTGPLPPTPPGPPGRPMAPTPFRPDSGAPDTIPYRPTRKIAAIAGIALGVGLAVVGVVELVKQLIELPQAEAATAFRSAAPELSTVELGQVATGIGLGRQGYGLVSTRNQLVEAILGWIGRKRVG